jgi:ribose transport system substrate-binding protein
MDGVFKMQRVFKPIIYLLILVVAMMFMACGQKAAVKIVDVNNKKVNKAIPSTKHKIYLIGMSQCNLGEPWRVAMNAEIERAAKKYPEFKVVFSDSAQDNSKQIADINYFIQQKVDLLIVSPNEAKPLTAVIKKAYKAGIPVILLDRRIEGDSYTQHIGADNVDIGKRLGEFTAKYLGKKGGNVVEIRGLEGTSGQKERHDGFREGIKKNPKVKIIASQNADWLKDKALNVMENMLKENKKIDVVFSHNDPMAEGAYIAAKNVGREKEMFFIGVDGLPTAEGGIKSLIEGRIGITYVYPTGGQESIENAYKLLVKKEKLEKDIILPTIEINKKNAREMYKKFGGK